MIATGFEEKRGKVELPQIKKWAPTKEPVSLKGSERVLAKSLDYKFEKKPTMKGVFKYEETIDLPTFLRKSPQKEF